MGSNRGAILAVLALACGCAQDGAGERPATPDMAERAPVATGLVPAPLYRDPVHDGAADPSITYDPSAREWVMFYTNRRANIALPDGDDVSWVHGTRIGIARSADGANWRYAGTADIPLSCTGATHWAPDVQWFEGQWHMWLTVVPGVFRDWNAPRFITHVTSPDLKQWNCGERLELGSDRVIDASAIALPEGGYRLFFNDERQNKAILYADSPNLTDWQVRGRLTETPGEGPKAFRWKGAWWLISDPWRGLLVMRSDDGVNWTRQEEHLLADAGTAPTDRAKGQHPDVIVSGSRAYLVYFVHQGGEEQAAGDPTWHRRSVLQIAELHEQGGRLSVDREAPVELALVPPR